MPRTADVADDRPVLVTGATGFIGGRLVDRLVDEGVPTRCLIRPHHPDGTLAREGVEVVRGDVTDAASVTSAVEGTQAVFHLAAVAGDWEPPDAYERVNVEGTRHVLDAALEAGAQVILASSLTVYGPRLANGLCDEDAPHGDACGMYSATKQRQEALAHEFVESGGEVVVLRFGNVYGPGSRLWVDTVADHLEGGLPSLIGDGGGDANLLHVENAIDALVGAWRGEVVSGETYNIVDGWGVTWAQYLSDLARLIGASPPRRMPLGVARVGASVAEPVWRTLGIRSRPPLTREAVAIVSSREPLPIDRARHDLGYDPPISYEEGLASVADYLRAKDA